MSPAPPVPADGAAGEPPAALDAALRTQVEQWIADDPDPSTRAALENLREQADAGDEAAAEEIRDAFSGDLEFGTAGLRGRMAPGPARMNLAAGISGEKLSHEEVLEAGREAGPRISRLLAETVRRITTGTDGGAA